MNYLCGGITQVENEIKGDVDFVEDEKKMKNNEILTNLCLIDENCNNLIKYFS